MKKIFIVFSSLVIAGMISVVQGAQLPYVNSFETYSYGAFETNDDWSFTSNSIMTITNVNYLDTLALNAAFIDSPITGAHDKVLSFSDAALTNSYTSTDPLVVIDTMIQPTLSQTPEYNAEVSNSQFSIMFVTNGVAIWQGRQIGSVVGADYADWFTLDNQATPVSSGKWCRLTVTLNYQSQPDDGEGGYNAMFQVKIDGQPLNATFGHVTNHMGSATNGSWLLMGPVSPTKISALTLKGSGLLDDLVVATNTIPDFVTTNHFLPFRWLTLRGVVTNESPSYSDMQAADTFISDADGDGMLNWQEYLAGTEPTNFESKLIILSQTILNGTNTIQWLSTTNALAPYSIAAASNLSSNDWITITNNLAATSDGTNTLSGDFGSNSPAFFRVQVTK